MQQHVLRTRHDAAPASSAGERRLRLVLAWERRRWESPRSRGIVAAPAGYRVVELAGWPGLVDVEEIPGMSRS
jgi:hypothetical protein